MMLLRKILFPFSIAYGIVTQIRNYLFDKGIFKSKKYDLPIICVGNLSVGGTGKSPMIEYLISLLKDDFKVAVLSRGYKRQTKGFVEVLQDSLVEDVGDEPLQFKKKFSDIRVAVCADRKEGIELLSKKAEVILLDDAFQHRKVKAGLNILLTTFKNPYIHDYIVPTGSLREGRYGSSRADVIVVTKTPNRIAHAKIQKLQYDLAINEDQEIYFTQIEYANTIVSDTEDVSLQYLTDKKFTLVTGIANSKPLVSFLEDEKLDFTHLEFGDHHHFSEKEIQTLKKCDVILTTEKDYMRLHKRLGKMALYYLPIKTQFIEREVYFEETILDFVHTYWNKIV